MEFSSTLNAVHCALAVQSTIAEGCLDVSAEQEFRLRIGIHVGEVIVDEDDIFGDAVNVAARLEQISESGGICLSARAHEEVLGKVDAVFEDGGTPPLKNITKPVGVWFWPPIGRHGVWSSLPLPDKSSIAVLPFMNLSEDPADELLVDGLVDELTTALARINWLFVAARTSAFVFKGHNIDVREAASRLGVRYILEGSIRRSGPRVRMMGQLIDASSGTHIWADHFDSDAEDILYLQESITESVVAAIEPSVLRAEIDRARSVHPQDMTAYYYYLRALGLFTATAIDVNDDRFDEARDLLAKAFDRDSNFAPALALAAYFEVKSMYFGRPASIRRALELAERAIRADPNDPYVLGYYGYVMTANPEPGAIDRAAILIDRALALNQNSPLIWTFSGEVRMYQDEHETAIEHLRRSMRLNPLDTRTIWNATFLAYAYFFMHQPDEAVKWAERAILTCRNPVTYRALAIAHSEAGHLDAAYAAVQDLLKLQPNSNLSRSKRLAAWKRSEDRDHYVEALSKAGLPE